MSMRKRRSSALALAGVGAMRWRKRPSRASTPPCVCGRERGAAALGGAALAGTVARSVRDVSRETSRTERATVPASAAPPNAAAPRSRPQTQGGVEARDGRFLHRIAPTPASARADERRFRIDIGLSQFVVRMFHVKHSRAERATAPTPASASATHASRAREPPDRRARKRTPRPTQPRPSLATRFPEGEPPETAGTPTERRPGGA